ncbi:rod shape-determining protein MreD [Sphingomonas sp. MMS24-J45]|uniref:rod shape-determining protein MreD n=1 Tax=Sphingomonas sp. MMS24-J45 TaxID=3238806 RepID=UPI00385038E0
MSQVRGPFDEAPDSTATRLLPAISVMIGSALTLWPIIATVQILPPFGLLMLLGWRLTRNESLRVWAPLPLGLFDDLISGQPLGSAMVLWTLCFFMIDLIDQRVVYRDFWQDWLIAGGAIGFCLILGRLVASPLAAHVDTVLLLQVAISVLLFPLAARLCVLLAGDEEDA